jgi:very-short-patch-repair endonuclease/predicted transcriptional regulator of viral defense system
MDTHIEAAIIACARGQHGAVTRQQLLQAGLSRRMIARRIRQGRLLPLYKGVYLVGPLPLPWSYEMAALLACGPRAVLSHWSAARVANLVPANGSTSHPATHPAESVVGGKQSADRPAERTVYVIMPPTGGGRRIGVRPYRTLLHESEVCVLHGMRVTTVPRTLFDLATPLGRAGETRRLEQLVASALDRGLTTEKELCSVLTRRARHRGAGLLRLVMAGQHGPALARSEAEERLLELIRAAALPVPRLNAHVANHEADFLWPTERLAVEVDGYAWHSSRNRFEGDRARDATITAAGFTVLRTTWRQITEEPFTVVARIALQLGRLRRE